MHMFFRLNSICLLAFLLANFAAAARADIVLYTVPLDQLIPPKSPRTTRPRIRSPRTLTITIQGKTTVNPGKTVTFRHPKFGTLYFALENVRIHELPSTESLAAQRLGVAIRKNDADQVMEAARWCLHHGLLSKFYEAVAKVLEINPQHPEALHVAELKRRMDVPIESTSEQEAELRKFVSKADMKLKASKHFILLHDTPNEPAPNHTKPRADERLELLETVYESFLLRFYSQGVELEIPREPLKAVLFSDHRHFLDFAERLSPELGSAAGFWAKTENVSVFYDQGTHESYEPLKQLTEQLQQRKAAALENVTPYTKNIVRMADTFALLWEIVQESSDIEVVSHEATHQMAGNTGLMPRHVLTPTWAAEGLATYFESPRDAAWSGIGAVNKQRLSSYRDLQRDRRHSDIDFIVRDQIFTQAQTHDAALFAYGQSWALTHFLMEKRFDELMTYYRRLGEMPPDVVLAPELLGKVFSEVFGEDRTRLDSDWRTYMRTLKTDLEKIMDERR